MNSPATKVVRAPARFCVMTPWSPKMTSEKSATSSLEELYQDVLDAQNQGVPKQLEAAHYALFQEIHAKGISHVAENAIETPSDVSSTIWQEGGEIASLLQEQKEMCDGCVKILTFQHQQ